MQSHLTIGFNTTTRYLETLAQRLAPSKESRQGPNPDMVLEPKAPLAAIFIPRFDQPSIMHSHLPLLTKTASLATPSSPPIRLVMLRKGAEKRLGASLSLPRVGLIGLIEGAPDSKGLIDFIRRCVPQVEVPWVQEAVTGQYLPVKVNEIEISAPLESRRKSQAPMSNAVKNK